MATIATDPTYYNTNFEHSYVFTRENGDQVNFCVDHTEPFGPFPVTVKIPTGNAEKPYEIGTVHLGADAPVHQLSLVVFDSDPDEPNKREEITLSFAEARLLRELLNRPEVQHLLETE